MLCLLTNGSKEPSDTVQDIVVGESPGQASCVGKDHGKEKWLLSSDSVRQPAKHEGGKEVAKHVDAVY